MPGIDEADDSDVFDEDDYDFVDDNEENDDYDFIDDKEDEDLDFGNDEEQIEEQNIEQNELEEKQHNGSFKGINNRNYKYDNDLASSIKDLKETEESTSYNIDTDNLITSDQKIISFVGTTKNGTSFIVNNLAELFSNNGIKTAILDLTKNKNSYYIYRKIKKWYS